MAWVLDFVWDDYLTAISEDIFDKLPTQEEAMSAYTHTLSWFSARNSIPKKDRVNIANIPLAGNYNNRAGLLLSSLMGCSNLGERTYFFELEKADANMKRNNIGRYRMSELSDPEVLPKYHPRIDVNLL